MDDRQTRIREGAGLEDSRINKEFVDFLNKWSSPVLLALAAAALVYAGLQWLERKKNAQIDQAFGEYEAAIAGGNPSPSSLRTIADDSRNDVRSVPELALLRAADIHLQAFNLGVAPGAQVDQATQTFAESDLLDESKRQQHLEEARRSAQRVLEACEGDENKAVLTMQALSRLAAVAEGQRDFDAAKGYYERLKSLGESQQFGPIVAFAEQRIANLDTLRSVPALPSEAEVPPLHPQSESATESPSGDDQPEESGEGEPTGTEEPAPDGDAGDSGTP